MKSGLSICVDGITVSVEYDLPADKVVSFKPGQWPEISYAIDEVRDLVKCLEIVDRLPGMAASTSISVDRKMCKECGSDITFGPCVDCVEGTECACGIAREDCEYHR